MGVLRDNARVASPHSYQLGDSVSGHHGVKGVKGFGLEVLCLEVGSLNPI